MRYICMKKDIKKDINLFEAYKVGNAKLGGKSNSGMVLLIVLFILIIAGGYGVLFLYQMNIEQKTENITKILDNPAFAETRIKLENLEKKNRLLTTYNNALSKAKENFDKTRIINNEMLNTISSAIPGAVIIKSMRVTPESVELTCIGTRPLDPAEMVQALNSKNLFDSVTYGGVTKNKESGLYHFVISCDFKEIEK